VLTGFEANKPGIYHLFCAEYCGTGHSKMIGRIVVMEPREYEAWLGGGRSGETLAFQGEKLFLSLGCATCHRDDPTARGPNLAGLFGRTVRLRGGSRVAADENYLRTSIVDPAAHIVDGFEPIMPAYPLGEEDLLKLIEYIKSLSRGRP
jgi:cytochrome c oxidase subunit 2